jgi:hypothetical protein
VSYLCEKMRDFESLRGINEDQLKNEGVLYADRCAHTRSRKLFLEDVSCLCDQFPRATWKIKRDREAPGLASLDDE